MNNSLWPIALVGIVFSIVILIFYQVIKRRNQRLPEEADLTPVHEEICGGRFNFTNFTIPFVRVALYSNFMVISAWSRYLLEYSAIERIELRSHVFSKGLHLYHTKDDLPSIILWSKDCDYLKKRIDELMRVAV